MTDTSDIRFLTGHDVALDQASGVPIAGALQRALFVVLALNANTDVSRDWLADLLWTDASQAQARQRLRMTLMNLRKCLEDIDGIAIVSTPDTIRLEVAASRIDVLRFESAAAETVGLYRGDFLRFFPPVSEEFDGFLAARRDKLRSLFLATMIEKLREARRAGEAAEFRRVFNAISEVDPTNDAAVELAMEFWSAEGRGDQVERVFEGYRRSLAEQVGVAPPDGIAHAHEVLRDQAQREVHAGKTAVPQALTWRPGPDDSEDNRFRWWPAAFMAFVLGAVVIAALWLAMPRSAVQDGPVFVVLDTEMSDRNCVLANLADDYRGVLLEALGTIENSTVVIGDLRTSFASSSAEVFVVQQRVDCDAQNFRGTTILADRDTRAVIVSFRHAAVPEDPAGLGKEIGEVLEGS